MPDVTRVVLGALSAVVALVVVGGCSETEDRSGSASPAADRQSGSYGMRMEQCLSRMGWEVTATDDGGFTGSVPVEQGEAFEAALEACRARLGYADDPVTMTAAEAASLYETYLDIAACMEELGYPPPEPPSRQAFIEEMVSDGLASWDPYMHLKDVTDSFAEIRRIEDACPMPR